MPLRIVRLGATALVACVLDPDVWGTALFYEGDFMNSSLAILLADGIYIGGGVLVVILIVLLILMFMRRA